MGIATKVRAYENLHCDVFIWMPHQSISGGYEALTADNRLVQDTDGRRFLRALKASGNRRNDGQ